MTNIMQSYENLTNIIQERSTLEQEKASLTLQTADLNTKLKNLTVSESDLKNITNALLGLKSTAACLTERKHFVVDVTLRECLWDEENAYKESYFSNDYYFNGSKINFAKAGFYNARELDYISLDDLSKIFKNLDKQSPKTIANLLEKALLVMQQDAKSGDIHKRIAYKDKAIEQGNIELAHYLEKEERQKVGLDQLTAEEKNIKPIHFRQKAKYKQQIENIKQELFATQKTIQTINDSIKYSEEIKQKSLAQLGTIYPYESKDVSEVAQQLVADEQVRFKELETLLEEPMKIYEQQQEIREQLAPIDQQQHNIFQRLIFLDNQQEIEIKALKSSNISAPDYRVIRSKISSMESSDAEKLAAKIVCEATFHNEPTLA